MDESVKNFFTKNADQAYIDQYDKDHGPRLDAMIQRFGLQNVKNSAVVDVGGGLGFLGKRLDLSNNYWVIDGAYVPIDKRLCNGMYVERDLDYQKFSELTPIVVKHNMLQYEDYPKFDFAFCLETLEHLTNPYNCLAEIKKLVKENGEIFISIPHANVTHNYIYPALMLNPQWFQQFLDQMALPTIEYWLWDKGWNAHHWRLRNAPWSESKMLYYKEEQKFRGKTPVEAVNI
jgi:2-polyprenyl-3-methyl-5-hydroxy-6-metoxy-1,4-benzoquinol methylase